MLESQRIPRRKKFFSAYGQPPGWLNRTAIQSKRGTVLVVDDDIMVLASVKAMFEDMGHTVVEVSSGCQALEFLRADTQVDLIGTDQSMPGMTGTQLTIAPRRFRPGIPVLLMTGFSEHADLLASGLSLLVKPFNQATLAKAIRRLAAC